MLQSVYINIVHISELPMCLFSPMILIVQPISGKEGNMGNDIKQFLATEDDCVYFYDEKHGIWKKVCAIQSPADLPLSVRQQVREAQDEADKILRLPL